MSASTFQSREACEAYFKIPGNYDEYRKSAGAEGMLNVFKTLGWNVSRIPLPEPPKPTTPMPVIPAAYFAMQSADVAEPVRESVSPSPIASESERADEASINARYNEYKSYLQAIFKPGDVICFVTIEHNLDNDREQETVHNTFATLEDALTKESFLNCVKANNSLSRNPRNTMPSIYVGMNTYPSDLIGQYLGRRQENVVEVRALQVDIDDAGNAATVVTAMQSCAKVPTPSIVVESSTGKRQGIWLVDEFPKGAAKPVMQAIAAEFGTDPAVAEIARVMRVPGFINRKPKYTDQPLAKLLSNTAMRYNRESFKIDTATVEKFDRTSPEEYLDAPFIRKGGPYGGIYSHVLKLVGHYTSAKSIDDGDVMFAIVKEHINTNGCFESDGKTPFAWNEEQVRKQCLKLVGEWETGDEKNKPILFNQRPDVVATAFAESAKVSQAAVVAAAEAQTDTDVPIFENETYPVFPKYVMSGTSIYRNLVQPWVERNSRIDYFLWLPSTAILLNYLSRKIKLKGQFAQSSLNGSIYMAIIGKRGLTNKSSCVDDAMEYFRYIGCLAHSGRDTKTAEGRSLVFTPGSSEGLGIEMQKTNCKNAIAYFDELKKLVAKAGIDNSALGPDLLTLYEGKKYSNGVKSGKEAFSLEPNAYSMSLITCCTDSVFKDLWTRMCGEDTGLNDRFMFVLQPEELPARRIKVDVDTLSTSVETKRLIDKAISQETFEVDWSNRNLQKLVELGDRGVDRAIKWALAIAVDMGLDRVDDESLDRGCDIVRYEAAVKRYLAAHEEAETLDGRIQLRIMDKLRRLGINGRLSQRELEDRCNADRLGTRVWETCFYGLIKAGKIRVEGTGKKGDPKKVQLLYKKTEEEL